MTTLKAFIVRGVKGFQQKGRPAQGSCRKEYVDGKPEWNVQEQRWQDEDKAGAQDQLQLAGHVTPQSHQGQPQGCVPVQSSPGLHKDTNAVQGGEE
eukprot:CAMPEP_0181492182 /NCGR_PEP_ID=MMETSP1110-20121109/50541_1 /TAXON_ID=174948 /ORGANISM="Symbiodinium sp., Strain CCMP421" /LENGTH=95 /DNA_ID=CAMNT_0023619389 /DNA_START=845 /DNA_END=1131 /DNA_ORIENTATION=-